MQGGATATSRSIQSPGLGRNASRRSQAGGLERRAGHSEHPPGAACHSVWQVGVKCLASSLLVAGLTSTLWLHTAAYASGPYYKAGADR